MSGRLTKYLLETPQIAELVAPADGPIVLLRDFGWAYDYSDNGCLPIRVDYASPVPDVDFLGQATTVQTDYGFLCPCRTHQETDIRVDRVHTDSGVTIGRNGRILRSTKMGCCVWMS